MSGHRLTVADIERWNAEAVREVFHAAQARGQAAYDASAGLAALRVFETWHGDTAEAAKHALGATRKDLDSHGQEVMAVANAAKTAADEIEALQKELRSLIAEAQQHRLTVNPRTSRVEFTDEISDPTDALIYMLDLQQVLDAILREADAIDDLLANAINMADGDAPIPAFVGPPQRPGPKLANQIRAFQQMFGRPPSSAADWETAAALDPHSYDPKNADVPPNIAVGRITPVPGQGVVRMNLFIPSKSVKDPTTLIVDFDDNAGDNRGFDSAAGPERSRVSLEIDYENGVVVARQNPSVNLTTGKVQTGTPTIKVAQRRDGSVYIDYAAADPFSPGGENLAKETVCVKGTIAVQPGADAPRIGGVATAFPALEVYNDRPGANGVPTTSTVVRMWPANVGQWGPELGLWWGHDIGDPKVLANFQGFSGVIPTVPLPTTELGPASNPPSVVMLK